MWLLRPDLRVCVELIDFFDCRFFCYFYECVCFSSFLLTAGWFPRGQWNSETCHYPDQHTENKEEGSCTGTVTARGGRDGWNGQLQYSQMLKFIMCFVVCLVSRLTKKYKWSSNIIWFVFRQHYTNIKTLVQLIQLAEQNITLRIAYLEKKWLK